jgi:hypothetical protein
MLMTMLLPYKQRYITAVAKCSAKPLSKILASIFTAVKTGLQKYHDEATLNPFLNSRF